MIFDSKVLVSVIVPVYNVEEYIERCLNSLCSQSFSMVEFIVVDDGSNDRSCEICDEFARLDSRFRVFHKENGGLSSARNYGIERACGDYLMFVDSDDWVRSDFCQTAYNCAFSNNADLVMFCHQAVNEDGVSTFRKVNIESGHKSWNEGIDLLLGPIGVYAWNKIYKRSLFDGIRYPEGRYYEDHATTWKLVCKAKNIYFVEQYLYFYYMRTSSIIHQETIKSLKDKFEMRMSFYDGIREKGYSIEKILPYMIRIALTYVVRMRKNACDSDYVRASEILKCNRISKPLSCKQRFLVALYLKNTYLFDLCCEINGWRLSEQAMYLPNSNTTQLR